MANVYLIYCEQGFALSNTGSGEALTTCSSGQRKQVTVDMAVLVPSSSAAVPVLDKQDVATVFAASFSMVVFCFFVARGIGAVLTLIRKG